MCVLGGRESCVYVSPCIGGGIKPVLCNGEGSQKFNY